MARLQDLAARGPLLWLDYSDYAAALLAGGQAPWLDTAACVAWLRKAQSLLRSDVVTLPMGAIGSAWLGAHPALLEAMVAKKRRAAAPLRVLLADEGLRIQGVDLALALRAAFAQAPLVLACPSPRRWVAWASARCAPGEAPDIDDDAVDSAASYMADFLRVFSQCGIDAVLLEEAADTAPTSAAALQLYQPVLNVASHYRWDIGLLLPQVGAAPPTQGLDFFVAPSEVDVPMRGFALDPACWNGTPAPACPSGGFRFATVPVAAQPEAVLARLADWR